MTFAKNLHCINGLRAHSLPLIIYGAGVVGRVLYDICGQLGLHVEAFCDGSTAVANTTFCQRPVIYAEDLPTHYHDAFFLISSASIRDVVEKLQRLGYDKWQAGGPLLEHYYKGAPAEGTYLNYEKFAVETCIWCHHAYTAKHGLYIRSLDVVITERCSLKCKDCSNLMQYYESPRDCNWDVLMASLERFSRVVDDVLEYRVIGGEAFLNRRWPEVVSRLLHEPKARRVVLYTNGTLLPSKDRLSVLRHPKALVIISDYGMLSKRLTSLTKTLQDLDITHYVLQLDTWLDCARIGPHHRTPEENTKLFLDCCAKNMLTLLEGRLYRCPFSANAFRLQAVPDKPLDYVELLPHSNEIREDILRAQIWSYLNNKSYLEVCDFCNGRPLAGPEVPPAVQIKTPLPYRKYPSTNFHGQ